MEIAAYLLEIQFWCCPGVGKLYFIFKPHRGAFAPSRSPKQNDKYPTNARGGGGGWACLELTEPVFCQESCLFCVIYNI